MQSRRAGPAPLDWPARTRPTVRRSVQERQKISSSCASLHCIIRAPVITPAAWHFSHTSSPRSCAYLVGPAWVSSLANHSSLWVLDYRFVTVVFLGDDIAAERRYYQAKRAQHMWNSNAAYAPESLCRCTSRRGEGT